MGNASTKEIQSSEIVPKDLLENAVVSDNKERMTENTASEQGKGFIKLDEDEVNEIEEMIKEGSMQSAHTFISNKLTQWKRQALNIAIIGNSGTGKSSFINAIRGLTADDEGAASVDINECTTEPTAYAHPASTEVKLWDLPGVGTPNYPKDETYLEKVGFERYDFFLIFCSNRFTENDLWLAQLIDNRGKKFYFVRSKIDLDLYNEKKTRPKTFIDEKTCVERIRNHISIKLEGEGFQNAEVFLVSNFDPDKWGFPDLCEELIQNLPRFKREAMTLCLNTFSEKIIKEKKIVLENRIWKAVLFAFVGAALTPLGILFPASISSILQNETTFYRDQFGLDDESLKILSEKIGKEQDYLKSMLHDSVTDMVSEEGLGKMLETFYAESQSEALYNANIIILFKALELHAVRDLLYWAVEKMEREALRILELTIE